jgi:hypothetical protein
MKKVVGRALEGHTANSKHTHPVVLIGKFAKEESREPAHRKGLRKAARKRR